MSRNASENAHLGDDNVYYLDDYRSGPTTNCGLETGEQRAARRHRLNRRRFVAAATGVTILLTGGVAWAVSRAPKRQLPAYCGYALVKKGQGGIAIADTAAGSQNLPVPDNETNAGNIINGMGPHENARYVMWIYSDGTNQAHIDEGTIQEWSGLDNPCPPGPQPTPYDLTYMPTPLQS